MKRGSMVGLQGGYDHPDPLLQFLIYAIENADSLQGPGRHAESGENHSKQHPVPELKPPSEELCEFETMIFHSMQ
jgi:hypothetical protein